MRFLANLVRRAIVFGGLGALIQLAVPAYAADYPSRPIMLVVAFPPGGPSDVLALFVGKKMEQIWPAGNNRNWPGAGGNVAGEFVAHAAPDGYTLLMGNNSILATNDSFYNISLSIRRRASRPSR